MLNAICFTSWGVRSVGSRDTIFMKHLQIAGGMGNGRKGGLSFRWSCTSVACYLQQIPDWKGGTVNESGLGQVSEALGTQFKEALTFCVVKCWPCTYLNLRASAAFSHAPKAPPQPSPRRCGIYGGALSVVTRKMSSLGLGNSGCVGSITVCWIKKNEAVRPIPWDTRD